MSEGSVPNHGTSYFALNLPVLATAGSDVSKFLGSASPQSISREKESTHSMVRYFATPLVYFPDLRYFHVPQSIPLPGLIMGNRNGPQIPDHYLS